MIIRLVLGIGYQVVQLISLPFVGIYFIMRAVRKKTVFGNAAQRCGFVPRAPKNKYVIWFHAVSVGETLLLQYLIETLKNRRPNCFVYVTSGTTSGHELAQKHINADAVSFIPFDFLIPTYLAFSRIKPHSLVLVEAEVWPNLFFLSSWFNTSLYMINARLRSSSLLVRTAIGRCIVRHLLNTATHLYTQDGQQDTYRRIGIPSQHMTDIGNVKIYNVVEKKRHHVAHSTITKTTTNVVILVGSIHPGELPIYLKTFDELRTQHDKITFIFAPRHFHWMAHLRELLAPYSYTIWNERTRELAFDTQKHDILVVAKLGILFDLYQHADIFCLGGTFVPVGGHNLLEPAVWSNPIITGPHDHMTQYIAQQLRHQGALMRVTDNAELTDALGKLIISPEQRKVMGAAALQWINAEYRKTSRIIDQFIHTV